MLLRSAPSSGWVPSSAFAARLKEFSMGSFSAWHWIIVLVVIVLLFGAKRIPNVMGDVAKGIKSFRTGLKDEPEPPAPAPTAAKPVDAKPVDAPKA